MLKFIQCVNVNKLYVERENREVLGFVENGEFYQSVFNKTRIKPEELIEIATFIGQNDGKHNSY